MSKFREPPHCAEAERAVLGSILLDATGPEDRDAGRILGLCVEGGIVHESFFDQRNATVYRAILEMNRAGKPTDATTLIERLRADGTLDSIGGATYVQSLIDGTPTTANAEYYIRNVAEANQRRELANFGTKLTRDAFDTNGCPDIETIRAKAETTLLALGDRQLRAEPTTATATHKAADGLRRILADAGSGVDGLRTGFDDLDTVLDGLKPGEMTVIGARPSDGKTSLALNIAENTALGTATEPGRPVLVFTLEMTTDALLRRMIQGRAGVSVSRARRRFMTPREKTDADERIGRAASEIASATLTICESLRDIGEIRSRARRERKRNRTELIVVDYLGLCTCNAARRLNSRQLEVAEISSQLKAMAKELKVPVLVLSQLSRANQAEKRNPCLSDLRDSGSIEQDADVVILLRRPSRGNTGDKDPAMLADRTLAILDVAKNRNGETGEVKLDFRAELTRFGNRRDPVV